MPACCDCATDLPREAFSKSQLKKKVDARRCTACAGKTPGGHVAPAPAAAAPAAAAPAAAGTTMPKTPFNSPEAAPRPTKGGGGGNSGSSKAKVEKLQIPEPEDQDADAAADDAAADFVVVESRAELESALTSALPAGLRALLPSLSEEQRALATALCQPPCDQAHLFASWDDKDGKTIGTERKLALLAQLAEMDATYPAGGLAGYVAGARTLLAQSRRGENPLDGWRPEVPRGEAFGVGTERWAEVERRGVPLLGKCGFVLVAGGLGERLGYGDIKVSFYCC